MASRAWTILAALLPAAVSGQPWEFDTPVPLTPAATAGVFHHLDASGRRHVAADRDHVAVVWEDNSEGRPAAYAAIASTSEQVFQSIRISGDGEAFEPVVTSAGAGTFLVGWEEDGALWLRLLRDGMPGERVKLADDAAQICLEANAASGDIYAVWSQRRDGQYHIRSARLAVADSGPVVRETRWVDDNPGNADQNHPAAAYHRGLDALLVVWEDRRYHNTVLLSAVGTPAARFSIPMQVNELGPPRSADYGRGTGVARVAVTATGDRVVAVWEDKRNFRFGYDVFAAQARHSGRFGDNALVQDGFGEGFEQWHAGITSGGGHLAVAWDDDRDGTQDVWLSWLTEDGWSDDHAVPAAAGPGYDSHPALALDSAGVLHLVWRTRTAPDAPTRLWYAQGRPGGAAAAR